MELIAYGLESFKATEREGSILTCETSLGR